MNLKDALRQIIEAILSNKGPLELAKQLLPEWGDRAIDLLIRVAEQIAAHMSDIDRLIDLAVAFIAWAKTFMSAPNSFAGAQAFPCSKGTTTPIIPQELIPVASEMIDLQRILTDNPDLVSLD